MASLLSLPQDLFGSLFALLPDAASKKAFFESCHAIHNALCVVSQITKAVVSLSKLHASLSSGGDTTSLQTWDTHYPELTFPRAAQLRELVIHGTKGTRHEQNDSYPILQLLRPQDEGMRAKVQQLTSISLKELSISMRTRGRQRVSELGLFLGKLPQLQVLRVDGPSYEFEIAGLIHSLGCGGVNPAARSLKELHCMDIDDHGIRAVSCLRSLQSLSFRLNAYTICDLQPLSSLSALRHLRIDSRLMSFSSSSNSSLEHLLPSLQCLNSLSLSTFSSTSLLSALPQSVSCIDIKSALLQDVCKCLEHPVAGQRAPSPLQLRLSLLDMDKRSNQPNLHDLSCALASYILACPSLSLIVERVENAASPSTLFECFTPLPQLARNLTYVRIGSDLDSGPPYETIAPNDLEQLGRLLPSLKGLEMRYVLFEHLQTSLNEVISSFPFLSRFGVMLWTHKQHGAYARELMAFLTALAKQEGRHGPIDVYVCLWVDKESDVSLVFGDARSLEDNWWQMRASLPAGARDVRVSAGILFTSKYAAFTGSYVGETIVGCELIVLLFRLVWPSVFLAVKPPD